MRHAQQVGNLANVLSSSTAKANQRVSSWIRSLGDRDASYRGGHVFVGYPPKAFYELFAGKLFECNS